MHSLGACDFGGPTGSRHLDRTVEFCLYLNMVVEEKQ